jgi:hypothetical protein
MLLESISAIHYESLVVMLKIIPAVDYPSAFFKIPTASFSTFSKKMHVVVNLRKRCKKQTHVANLNLGITKHPDCRLHIMSALS